MRFFKSKKKKNYYWDDPKWTPEMLREIENIFKDFEISKSDDDDGISWKWEIKLNVDVDLSIILDRNLDISYLAFFSVETNIAWQNHANTWLEFEHCDTWEYLLERLNKMPNRYGFKSLGKSYSKYWLEKLD